MARWPVAGRVRKKDGVVPHPAAPKFSKREETAVGKGLGAGLSNRSVGPTPQRLAKAGDQVEAFSAGENVHHQAIRMLDGHILERLASRNVITGDQYNAGTRFYGDWYFSGLAASGVIDPGRVVVDGGETMTESDRKLAAMTSYKRAVQALGLVHSTVITDLVLLEVRVEDWGRRWFGQKAQKLARAQAHAALQLALTELDHHYYGQRQRRDRRSHADDYRPSIMPLDEAS